MPKDTPGRLTATGEASFALFACLVFSRCLCLRDLCGHPLHREIGGAPTTEQGAHVAQCSQLAVGTFEAIHVFA